MISEKVHSGFNDQINAEMYSAYLYLSMSAHFESEALHGFANWMNIQAREEMVHAMKFYNFILERGGRVELTTIEGPPTTWDSPLAIFEASLAHEKMVTGLIDALMDLATAENDHAAGIFLQWFVTEQVEEEASAQDVVQKIHLVGDAPGGLFILDKEMAGRVFTPPPGGE